MKYRWIIVLLVGFVVNCGFSILNSQFSILNSVSAQTDVILDPEVGGRLSVGLDKKIVKGLHVSLEEEARFDKNFRSFDRLQTTLGLSYKVNKYFKCGIGYVFMNPYSNSSSSFGDFRHRLFVDATGTVRMGKWSLSLKERFQWTYRSGDFNEYQYPRNALTLKSRLTLKYRGFAKVTPYAYFEIRNFLNAPVIHALYDGTSYLTEEGSEVGEAGWFLHSFKGGYINRYRGSVGVDWKISKHHQLNFYFLGDYVSDKVVDANADGTKLKSYTKEKGFRGTLGAGYVYAF